MNTSTSIKAFAVKDGMDSSDIAIAEYVIDPDTISIPNFNPSSGTYNLPQSVEITCDTDGATIYYTTDNVEGEPVANFGTSSVPCRA